MQTCVCFDGKDATTLEKQEVMDLLLQWRQTGNKPEFPENWEAHRDGGSDDYDKPRSYGAQYRPKAEIDAEYWVPCVTLSWQNEATLDGGFMSHPFGCCGYCGADLEGEMFCPSCGSC
jgi:hypothetical protein